MFFATNTHINVTTDILLLCASVAVVRGDQNFLITFTIVGLTVAQSKVAHAFSNTVKRLFPVLCPSVILFSKVSSTPHVIKLLVTNEFYYDNLLQLNVAVATFS